MQLLKKINLLANNLVCAHTPSDYNILAISALKGFESILSTNAALDG